MVELRADDPVGMTGHSSGEVEGVVARTRRGSSSRRSVDADVDGTEGLANNPVSRVDFYAVVALEDAQCRTDTDASLPPVLDGPGLEALKLITSVDGNVVGAEDFDDDGDPSRRYVWSIDMSEAEFIAAVGDEDGTYNVIAFAVNDDGVALYAAPIMLKVEK